jgi:hypothetical protein
MVTRAVTGEDDYGDESISESTQTVTARVVRRKSPQHAADAAGEYVNADVEIHVSGEYDVDETPPETLFRVDDVEYEVIRADDQDGGIIVADCKRRT